MKLNLPKEIRINVINGIVGTLAMQYEYVNFNEADGYIYFGDKPQGLEE